MSLNQLALVMWERLGCRGIDPSVLSRVLRGERLFTFEQLELFTVILKLSDNEKKQLEGVLYREVGEKFGFTENFFFERESYDLELIKDNIDKIRQVNNSGMALLAEEWADHLDEKISREFTGASNLYRNNLFKLRFNLLIEKGHLNFRTKDKETLLYENLKICNNLNKIAKNIKNYNDGYKINFLKGDSYYVSGKFEQALRFLRISSDKVHLDKEGLFSLRTKALSLARLKKEFEFDKLKKDIIKRGMTDNYFFNYHLYEGISRAETEFGRRVGAFKALERAKSCLSKTSNIQGDMLVTNAEIEAGLAFGENKTYLENIGRKAYNIALRAGHQRYIKKLGNFINTGIYNYVAQPI
ncbi:hypothetical protein HY045_01045 [Candidatus Woesebacteria bacterium]|nr:hypothetical protein [Candidatus Woesebacteria bacterium]